MQKLEIFRSLLYSVAVDEHVDLQNLTSSAKLAIWVGQYETWEECNNLADRLNGGVGSGVGSAFESARWIARQQAMYEQARCGSFPRACFLPTVVTATQERSVFDLGGGSGWPLELINLAPGNRSIRYNVIEQEHFISAVCESSAPSPQLQFLTVDGLGEVGNSESGILHANSVLQYLASDDDFAQVVRAIQPKWILLDDIQVSTQSQFFSMQRYFGQYIVHRFLNLGALLEVLSSTGFVTLGVWPYPKEYSSALEARIEGRTTGSADLGPPVSVLLRAGSTELGNDIA